MKDSELLECGKRLMLRADLTDIMDILGCDALMAEDIKLRLIIYLDDEREMVVFSERMKQEREMLNRTSGI